MSPSESELLLLLAIDLYRYFPQVVVRYQQRLYAFARRLTGSAQEAEDIVQEAFVSAYVSLENYPPQRVRTLKLQAWLYRITLYVYS
ncbi:MAG TPA: sigma factor, partial [Ktedonobacteraceae bacterium]|nr:sigma factor [Ktedonobacteraceae bacterium]